MKTVDEMANEFKTINELKQYAQSQFVLINSLNKKINELETENKHLNDLLQNSAPVLQEVQGKLELYKDVSDEMATCLLQIKILKDRALSSELTLEEAKKLDIYTKLLISLTSRTKEKPNPASGKTDEEILAEIENLSK